MTSTWSPLGVGRDGPLRQYSPLTTLEQELVRYAIEALDGAFTVDKLYEAFKGRISKRKVIALAQTWERRGWLTTPEHRADARRITGALLATARRRQA